jgi:hypothetical protein
MKSHFSFVLIRRVEVAMEGLAMVASLEMKVEKDQKWRLKLSRQILRSSTIRLVHGLRLVERVTMGR